MAPRVETYFEILQKLAAGLHQLAADLKESCTALVAMDLNRIYQHIAHQEYLASASRALDQERIAWERQFAVSRGLRGSPDLLPCLAADLGPDGEQRCHSLLNQVAAARQEVGHWNRLYAALLAHARQSVNALGNGLVNLHATYAAPGPGAELAPSLSQET